MAKELYVLRVLICGLLVCSVGAYSQECTVKNPNNTLNVAHFSVLSFRNANSSDFPTVMDCYWRITAPKGYFLSLTFNFFDVYASYPCSRDYVEVREGTDGTGHVYGKLCGTTIPNVIYSSGQDLYVRFHFSSANLKNYNGITATLSTIQLASSCSLSNSYAANNNIHLTEPSGTFTTPSYDLPYAKYPVNSKCTWRIIAPPGYIIKVEFVTFELENNYYDFVQFNDGLFSDGTSTGKFCGSTLPRAVYSAANELRAYFKSDGSSNYKGFKAVFHFLKTESTGLCTNQNPSPQMSGMGGTFFTPNYPKPYPAHARCTWNITVPVGYHLKLSIMAFSVYDSGSSCAVDYLKLYDGSVLASSNSLGKFCGSISPKDVYIRGRTLWAQFVSQTWTHGNVGFRASYEAVKSVANICSPANNASINDNLHLSRYSGDFYSPNYPANYPSNMQCTWTLTAPPGKRIKFSIPDLNFGPFSGTCNNDYLQVRDGKSAQSTKKGDYCSSSVSDIYSSKRYLWVRFHSDFRPTYKGFHASYKVVNLCDSSNSFSANNDIQFNASSGNFTSPSYPSSYPTNIQCTWKITVPSNKRVKLRFLSFAMEYNSECTIGDYVRVRDGLDSTSHALGTYCGYSNPGSIYSTGDHMWVSFHSDIYSTSSGFKATFTAVDKANLIGAIVGGVVGSVVALVIIIAVTVYCVKRNRRGTAQQHHAVPQTQPSPMPPQRTYAGNPHGTAIVNEPPAPIVHGVPPGYPYIAFHPSQQPSPYLQQTGPHMMAPYPGYQQAPPPYSVAVAPPPFTQQVSAPQHPSPSGGPATAQVPQPTGAPYPIDATQHTEAPQAPEPSQQAPPSAPSYVVASTNAPLLDHEETEH